MVNEPMRDWERQLLESTEIEWAERDQRLLDILFNDITFAPRQSWLPLSDRLRLRDYLWEQGWRREERPGDSARRCGHSPDEVCERCSDG